MRKITILTALLLTTFVLHSQNLKKIIIEECERSEILDNTCADYKTGKYDCAMIVFNTNIPDLNFEIVNAKNNLVKVKPELEKNRYILCIEPMGELYNVYRIEITGKEIRTEYVNINDIKPKDKRFYNITASVEDMNSKTNNTNNNTTTNTNIIFTVNGVSFEMIYVEGGTFVMGCTSEQKNCGKDESPVHRVTLSDFYIGKYQVTQELWYAVIGTTISQQRDLTGLRKHLYGKGDNYPMYYINFDECQEFCDKLNTLLANKLPKGYKFCLPTEAQWEYAARGGKKSKGYIYSGSNLVDDVAWYIKKNTATHEVGMKEKNELGIYDMSGNVWEWCRDVYAMYRSGSQLNPNVSDSYKYYSYHIMRGGSFISNLYCCHVTCRYKAYYGKRDSSYGFRISLTTY